MTSLLEDSSNTAVQRDFSSTDDCCVFIDDTFSREVAEKVIGCSPSAKAFLSPQRQPVSSASDVIPFGADDEKDELHTADIQPRAAAEPPKDFPFPPPPPPMAQHEGETLANSNSNSGASLGGGHSSAKRRRFSTGRALMDMTNRDDSLGRNSTGGRPSLPHLGSGSALCTTPKVQIIPSTSPQHPNHSNITGTAAPPANTVSLAEFHKVEQQRDRYKKMYEHQKEVAEKAMALETENYDKLQAKIVEVVALQSRCEETKRFVRQLKKEILGVRQRELPVHNKIAEDLRLDVMVKEKFSKLLAKQREQFEEELVQTQDRLDSVENLLADVSTIACMRPDGCDDGEDCHTAHDPVLAIEHLKALEAAGAVPEGVKFDVKKLDRLLTESYYESTALVNELRRTRRDLEKETDKRMEVESEMAKLKKQQQELEIEFANERRKMMLSDERRAESQARLKSEVLTMREEMVRLQEAKTTTATPCSRDRSVSTGGFSASSASDDEDCYRVHYNRSEGSSSAGRNSATRFSATGSVKAPSMSPLPTKV